MPPAIRTAIPDDAAAIRAIYAPFVEGTAVSFETRVPTVEDVAERIRATLERYPWLVCERPGGVVGYAYATQHRARTAYQWAVETSVFVAADARRGGVGRTLYAALLETLVRQGFRRAFAVIAQPNEASIRFHEEHGFTHLVTFPAIGFKLGRWHDTGWWQRPLADGAGAVEPPVWFPDLAAG